MGSFLSRIFIQSYSIELNGVILVGTGFTSVVVTKAGKSTANLLSANEKSPLMNKLIFGNYNKRISNAKTFDWLTRDENELNKYVDDPLCGFIPTARYFYDLLTGIEVMVNRKDASLFRKDRPILLVSGDQDPVGTYGKVFGNPHTITKKSVLRM